MKSDTNQSAFSLLEVIFASGIALLLLTSLVSMTTISVRNASYSRNRALATKYAREEMERVRSFRDTQGFSNISCGGHCFIDSSLSSQNGEETVGTTFTRYFQVSSPGNCPTGASATPKEVVITVTWQEGSGSSGGGSGQYSIILRSCFTNWRVLPV